jgi:hypothetical protein
VISTRLRQAVRERAGRRCEYCRFREEHLPFWPFHLEHMVATAWLLQMNSSERVELRRLLIRAGRW